MCYSSIFLRFNQRIAGKYKIIIDRIADIQNIILLILLDFLCSLYIIVYDKYSNSPVIITNNGLYLTIFAKYALPRAPRPRGANIKPPVQQRVANKDVKTGKMLNNFFFKMIASNAY